MQYLPLAGIAAVIVISVFWRSWLQRRRYGSWGIVLFRSQDARQTLRDGLLVLLAVLVLGQAVGFALWPERISRHMVTSPRNLPGALALFSGVALMIKAQLDLGASWRIGVDEGARPGLVGRGLYALSRNPIYVGMLTALLGFTLLIPTPLSLIIFAGSLIGVRQQVLGEEAYLRRTYGADFLAYAKKVGRFLPWIGRLVL